MFKNHLAKILMLGLPLAILILFLILAVYSKKSSPSSSSLNIVPTPTPSIENIENVSPWAKDDNFIQLEQAIIETEKKLDKVNLREFELDPPVLDLNVKL